MASKVEDIWKEVTSSISSSVSDCWWTRIGEKYDDEKRKYHNLEHLQEKLTHFQSVKPLLKNPDSVALAIVFH